MRILPYALPLLAALAHAAPIAAQQAERTIRVSATGQVQATPDEAFLDLAVETTAPTAKAASEENARTMDRLIAALVAAGVPRRDIETRLYSVHPEYARPRPESAPEERQEPRIRGYRVSNVVTVRTPDVSRVGGLIDTALQAGANRVNGVRFGIRDPDAVRAQALRRAVEKARAEAQTLASALGVRLGTLLDATTTAGEVRPMMRMRATAEVAAASPTPIQPGEQTVTAVVTLVYQIQP